MFSLYTNKPEGAIEVKLVYGGGIIIQTPEYTYTRGKLSFNLEGLKNNTNYNARITDSTNTIIYEGEFNLFNRDEPQVLDYTPDVNYIYYEH